MGGRRDEQAGRLLNRKKMYVIISYCFLYIAKGITEPPSAAENIIPSSVIVSNKTFIHNTFKSYVFSLKESIDFFPL